MDRTTPRWTHSWLGIVAVAVMACQQAPSAKGSRTSAPTSRGQTVPTTHRSSSGSQAADGSAGRHGYPGASRFCSGHVTGAPQAGTPGPHISWVAYATADAQAKVAKHYRSKLGQDGYSREGTEETWRVAASKPEVTISLSPATESGPWNQCGDLPADAATVIVHSTMVKTE